MRCILYTFRFKTRGSFIVFIELLIFRFYFVFTEYTIYRWNGCSKIYIKYTDTHTRTQTLRQLTICVDFFNGSNTYVFSRSDGLKWSYFRTFVFLIRAWTLPQREIHAAITRDIYLKFSWNSTAILCTHDTRQSPLIYLCMTGVSF